MRAWLWVLPCLLALTPSLRAGEAEDQQRAAARRMAERIDELLAERWRQEGVTPAPLSGDSEFLRRVCLDLTGVVPTVAQVHDFHRDTDPDKRAKVVEQLLDSPAHPTHLANLWRNTLLPGGFDPAELNSVVGLQNWLRQQFAENMRYDRIVADFLVASGGDEYGPALYYTSLELKPEKLAASTARIFLGLQLECAECHDHPYDARWTQRDFWSYAAFFARLEQNPSAMMGLRIRDLPEGEVVLPGTEDVVVPQYPGGRQADPSEGGSRRAQLAIWMASRDNPYLARAAANWAWAHLFGRGLVEPAHDLGPHNPPSHPQLLDELADYFVASGFDLRQLLRTLASTRAYQLSSRSDGNSHGSPELFARMSVKPLTPEQLYDCISQALTHAPSPIYGELAQDNRFLDMQRLMFIASMQSPGGKSNDYQAGVPQALMLMNGPIMNAATSLGQSRLLTALEAPWFDDTQRVETLFLATLSRPPSAAEHSPFIEHVASGQNVTQRREALSDVLWALLNSAEFALNH